MSRVPLVPMLFCIRLAWGYAVEPLQSVLDPKTITYTVRSMVQLKNASYPSLKVGVAYGRPSKTCYVGRKRLTSAPFAPISNRTSAARNTWPISPRSDKLVYLATQGNASANSSSRIRGSALSLNGVHTP